MATIKTNRSGACWFRRPGPDNISLELVRSATSILKEVLARTDRDWLHLLRRRGSDPFMAFCERRIGRIRNYPPPARHSIAADHFSPAVGLQELYKSVMIAGYLLPSELAVTGGQNSARSKPASPPLKLSIWRCSRSPARKARGSERVAVAPYLMRRCVASVFC